MCYSIHKSGYGTHDQAYFTYLLHMKHGTVCITGATSGIGRAYARQFAARGYSLILTGRRERELRALTEELPVQVEVRVGDLREPAVCADLAARLESCSDLAVLVHNAGYGHNHSFLESPPGELREMGELHMQCTVELVRAAVPAISGGAISGGANPDRGGAVILVSSLAAFMPAPGPAMYTASKAFMVFLGRALQADLASRGIRIQVLCPGFTHTDFHDRLEWGPERRRNRGLVRWMAADDVVERSLRRLRRSSPWSNPVYVPGVSNRVLLAMVRWMPRRLYLVAISRFRF